MKNLPLYVLLVLMAVFASGIVVFNQFPDQQAEFEKYRKSVLKKYLPAPKPRMRRG